MKKIYITHTQLVICPNNLTESFNGSSHPTPNLSTDIRPLTESFGVIINISSNVSERPREPPSTESFGVTIHGQLPQFPPLTGDN